jgi:hypothetical protein
MEMKQKLCEEIADEAKLNAAEAKLNAKLPKCYRDFLQTANGGKPVNSKFRFKTNDGTEQDSTVHYFFGLCTGAGNLIAKFELFKGRIPLGYLPIASDPFGNLILIRLFGQDPPVFFWDHEMELNEATGSNVSPIAKSF